MLVANEKHSANGHSGNCGCAECVYGPFTRNHYFTGKLLVERDFRDEQLYYIDKHLMHQQRLHGEGVVCGLQVVQHDNPACRDRFVCVKPGLAIDCCGHDVLVTRKECIDITQFAGYKKLTQTVDRLPHALQICIRYKECPTEDVPVLYDECGCDDTACAPNRILESYEFDLIVDPDLQPTTHCVPTLNFKAALPVAGAGPIVARNAVYVLAPNLRTISKLDLAGSAVTDSLTLNGDGRALAISEDGKTLYVAALNATPGTKTELWAIDTTVPLKLPAAPAPLSAAAAAAAVELQTPPGDPGKLFSLNSDTGELIFWDVTAAPPAQTATVALAANAYNLVAGNKGLHAYAIDSVAQVINVVDVAAATKTNINILAQPALLALANATTPDILFVADKAGPSANALKVDIPKILGTQPLSAVPAAVVVSPDDRFIYLVLPEVGGKNKVRPLDLDRLIAGTPEPPGDGPLVDPSAASPAISPDGSAIYYPETNAATQHSDVAILAITPHVCPDLYEVADCPSCEQPDCLVLATIVNYRPGFLVEDLPAAASDFASHIARIDNRLGRRILPSTQKIAEVLECLLECGKGGIPGPKGDRGDPGADGSPGKDGKPGLGLNATLPKIIDIGWVHQDVGVLWDTFRILYGNPNAIDLIRANPKSAPLVIYFNEKMSGIDRQTYRVSLSFPQMGLRSTFSGLYNVMKLDFVGTLVDLGPGAATSHTAEPYASAWAFLPQPELFTDPLPVSLISPAWNVFLKTHDKRDLPCLRIVLSGDFVYSPNLITGNYDETRMLDANNIGGQVGLIRTRGTPFPASPMNPSGNLVEGGDFEGWFFFQPPKQKFAITQFNLDQAILGRPALVRVNQAPLDELQTLPGITATVAKKLIRERERLPFASIDDFQSRLGLSAQVMSQLADKIEVD